MDRFLIYAIDYGWVTKTGTYSSDWKEALAYDWEQAKLACMKHRAYNGQFDWIPVPLYCLHEVLAG